jgi:hypothetical protein
MADGGVHLVGSIPLLSAEEVFTRTAAVLPGRLQSIPDGETGVRDNYIVWLRDRFPGRLSADFSEESICQPANP